MVNHGELFEACPLDTRRLKYVLIELMTKYTEDVKPKNNAGWGISVHRSFVSYVVVATKIKVQDGNVTVLEMYSVIDAGTGGQSRLGGTPAGRCYGL